ncbi:MAG: class I SAM-dependent methyltransferase [Oscillospiraceae bacterium]|nr:class I SAM-dependent methyltransferase [Oscillospiraceae bacterium]
MTIRSDIISYWDRRAPTYTDVIMKNLEGEWDGVWADMLISRFPAGEPSALRVLDVGTGPGFYAIILAERGYPVTAVDFSENMLAEARRNAGDLAGRIDFRQMDAQQLSFPDDSFDAVVTRNLTWNLTDPVRAYREWHRVLRPGGTLLIFDANWYAYLNDPEKKRSWDRDRENTRTEGVEDHDSYADSRTMEDISRSLPMTPRRRPQWDMVALLDLGFSVVSADTTVGDRVWNREEKINYASTPGFLIRAVK